MSIFDIEDGCNKNMEQIISEESEILKLRNQTKWTNSKYEFVKTSSKTPQGDFGEAVTSKMLKVIGLQADIVNHGIGTFDILITMRNGFVIKIEHKLATEDTNCCYQFNGIKKDIDYDFVFCMGVSPTDMFFSILTKDSAQYLTTTMAKNVAGTYKYTVPAKKMIPYTVENFKREIENLVK